VRRYGYQPGVDLTLPPLSSCLPRLRRTAQRALRGVDGDVAEDVLLDRGWVQTTVRDHGPTATLPRVPAGPPPTLADGGRGLWLISQLVDELRVERWRRGVRLALRRRAASRVAGGIRGA
jgi:Histidine kinase-like ATPase domain